MAAADATFKKASTFESDTTIRTIKIGAPTRSQIAHKSGDRVFIAFDADPVTSELQVEGTFFLDAGDSWPVPKGVNEIRHRAKATTAVLFFNPDFQSP